MKKGWIPEEKFKEIEKLMPIVCVNAMIVNEKDEVLLMLRNNEPLKGLYWFPGGRIKIGQSFEDTLKEEIEEETGLKWSDVEIFNQVSGSCTVCKTRHTVEFNFLLMKKTNSKIKLNEEHSDFKWVKIKDLDKYHPYLKWALFGDWKSWEIKD